MSEHEQSTKKWFRPHFRVELQSVLCRLEAVPIVVAVIAGVVAAAVVAAESDLVRQAKL
jgi:hypothetical protein